MKKSGIAGSVAIITGAAGGIGTEIARLMDAKGVNCVLCDIDGEGLARTAGLLGREALCVRCDITSRDDINNAIETARRRFNRIDILINNAGIIIPSLFECASYEDIDRQIKINLAGALYFSRAIIEPLKESGGGYIITVSSLAGIVPETYSAVYCATKFALRGFNLTLNIELKKHNIFTGAVFPDSIDTPMLRHEAEHGGSPLTFLGAPQKPEKVARAVLRAITRRRIETHVPAFSATLPKILMCIPGVIPPIWRVLERMGEKNKRAYQEKIMNASGRE